MDLIQGGNSNFFTLVLKRLSFIFADSYRPEDDVFLSANRLINHTNALLGTYKALGY